MTQITLLVGKAAALPGADRQSGIDKRPVDRPLRLGPQGFEGDKQADRRVHGGPEKAVHHYPFDHYAAWAEDLAAVARGVHTPRPPWDISAKENCWRHPARSARISRPAA